MITVLTGANSFAVRTTLHQRMDAFRRDHGDMAVEQHDAADIEYTRMVELLQGVSLFAPDRLVVLREPGVHKQFLEQCETILAGIPDGTDVIFIEPQLDKRTAYYKWLKKHVDVQDFPELDDRALATWAVAYANEQGAVLRRQDAEYLIHRIGASQSRLANELTKLALSGKSLTRELIDEQTKATPQSKIFDLLDAVFAGQSVRAAQLYREQRQLKVEPPEITAMLGWQLRQVALIKTAEASRRDAVREAGISPYSAGKARRIASRLTLAQLKQCVADLVALDARSKSASIDMDEALQLYLISVSRRIVA